MRREDPTENLSRDMAGKIASYLGSRNNFFSFSSVNRKFRRFFQSDRENIVKIGKIQVKKNGMCSFLHTFEGELFVSGLISGSNRVGQWTRIRSGGKPISEFVFYDNEAVLNLFVRCDKDWYQMRDGISGCVPLLGPQDQKILELIPGKSPQAFIRCPDDGWYVCTWKKNEPLDWKILSPPSTKIIEIMTCRGRDFIRCEEGWYARGTNSCGELGIGNTDDQTDWVKFGPPDKTILELKANNFNTLVYCDDGFWYGCGQNNHGQLGIGKRKHQLNWIILGPEHKEIKSVFLQEKRIFVHCSDGLYAAGAVFSDNSRDLKNWTKLGFANTEILDIFGATNATFIRCSDGWYYLTGDNRTGIFGLYLSEHATGRWIWEKLRCEGRDIVQLIPSQKYVFAACVDAWYFTGSNVFGQNGMNDALDYRTRWMKMFSHGEDVESAVALATIKIKNIQKIPSSLRFRQALKKLYEPDKLLWLQNTLIEYCVPHLRICYHKNYPTDSFYFFFPSGSRELRSQSTTLSLQDRIKEILDYSNVFVLMEHDFNSNFFQRIPISEYPLQSLWASLLPEKIDELIHFLKAYEKILDDDEKIESDFTLGFGI